MLCLYTLQFAQHYNARDIKQEGRDKFNFINAHRMLQFSRQTPNFYWIIFSLSRDVQKYSLWVCSVLWKFSHNFFPTTAECNFLHVPSLTTLSLPLLQSSWMVLAFFENCHFPNWNNNCFMLCLFAFLPSHTLYVFFFFSFHASMYNCTVGCQKNIAKYSWKYVYKRMTFFSIFTILSVNHIYRMFIQNIESI